MYFNLVSYQNNNFFDQNYSCSSYMHQITWERKENGISRKLLNDVHDLNHVHLLLSLFMPFLFIFFFHKRFRVCSLLKHSKFSDAQKSGAQNFGAQISHAQIYAWIFGTHSLKTVLNNTKKELPLLWEQQENCETCFLLHQ